MTLPRASFVQIGTRYFATIRSASGEDILMEGGKRKPFDSAIDATRAAMRAIEASRPPPIELPPARDQEEPHDLVRRWNTERAERMEKDRQLATLMGVTVVRKRKRTMRP